MSSRKHFVTRNALLTVLLLFGIACEANFLARKRLVKRVDLTEDREYTISPASRRILGGLRDRLLITAYFTPKDKFPAQWVSIWQRIADTLEEYRAHGKGKVALEFVDPAEGSQPRMDAERMGVRPFPVQVLEREQVTQKIVSLGIVMRYQDRDKTIPLIQPGQESSLEYQLTTAIKSLVSERNPKVVFFSREPEKLRLGSKFPEMPQPERIFQRLRDGLASTVEIEDVKLKKDLAPADADVLVVARPKEVTDHEKFAIDQHVMRGGRLLLLYDRAEYPQQENFRRKEIASGIDDLLEHWGVRVRNELVFDASCGSMPTVQTIKLLGSDMQVRGQMAYPFWAIPTAQFESFSKENPVTDRLERAIFYWSNPVETIPERLAEIGATSEALVRSTHRSWSTEKVDQTWPEESNLRSLEVELVKREPTRSTIVLALSGRFPSFFEGKEPPSPESEGKPGEKPPETRPADSVIPRSPDTRLVVVGDADFAADYALGQRTTTHPNFVLLANVVDWLSLDPDLIGIRSRGARNRSLDGLQKRREAYLEELGVRPGEQLRMTIEEYQQKQDKAEERLDGFKTRIKYANLFGVPSLVVLAGIARALARYREKKSYLGRFKTGEPAPAPGGRR